MPCQEQGQGQGQDKDGPSEGAETPYAELSSTDIQTM